MRIPRSVGAFSAFLIVVLGAGGALIPFVGPYFDYSFGVNSAWHYTTDRLWLDILPGAVAVLAGLMLLGAATRGAGLLAGWFAVVAGGWFAIGPAVARTWEHGTGPIGGPLFGTTRQALELIGYFYGLGALIAALGAFAIGRFSAHPGVVEETAVAGATRRRRVAPAPVGGAGPAGEPVGYRRAGAGVAGEPDPAGEPGAGGAAPAPEAAEPRRRLLRPRRRRALRGEERQGGILGR